MRRFFVSFAATAVAACLTSNATAQQVPAAVTQYEAARAAMLSDIDNPEKAFTFAEAAVAVGDLRGAIDALERVLTLNPDLTNIRFELGLLYLRAGAPDIAESYLRDVLADPQTPAPIRARTKALLEEIAGQQARHRFSGSLSTGLRHESNANASPDRLLVAGLPFNVSPQDQATSDLSATFSARLRHAYDMGGQYGPFLETDLTLFSQAYQDVTSSDVFFLQLSSGPRIRFGLEGRHAVRPYLGVSTLFLGQEHYGNAALLGAEYAYALDDRSLLRAEVSARWQSLYASDVNPTAERFEGRQIEARLGYRRALTERLAMDAGLVFSAASLASDFESNRSKGVEITLRQTVGNFFDAGLDPAVLTLSAGYARAEYDAVNPEVDPSRVQQDDRWRLGLAAAVPVSDDWVLDAGLSYARNDSSLPNDSYDNLQISLGVTYSFRRNR